MVDGLIAAASLMWLLYYCAERQHIAIQQKAIHPNDSIVQ